MLGRLRLLIVPAVAACLLAAGATPAAATAQRVVSDDIALNVKPNGDIQAKETIVYDFGSGADGFERKFVTRKQVDDSHDRVFPVRDVTAKSSDGAPTNVTTRTDDDTTIVTVGKGHRTSGRHTITLSYTVLGAMTPQAHGQELNWTATGGWTVPVAKAKVTVDAGAAVRSLNCFAGELDSRVGCTQFFTNHTHTRGRFVQQNLMPGEYLTIVVGYPKGTTTGEPITEQRHTLATAFTVNGLTGGALLGLLVVLVGGVAMLYRGRGRDARIVSKRAPEGDQTPVAGEEEFSPPDGVRPGQVGTLIDEQADVIDVTATVIDLAVRGYLLIEELPRATHGVDWRLRRLDRPNADLLEYERMLYDALFANGDVIRLSELGGTFSEQLAAVRAALYDDVVGQGWFLRRPDSVRTLWTTAGMIMAGIGVIGTVALAIYTEFALIGLALIIAGAALAFGGQYMPAKTTRGATVLAHTLGFRAHLQRTDSGDGTPAARRISLFSRYLPYAVVFDAVPRWAQIVADVDGEGERADNLYWYEGPAEWDLSGFAESMRSFTLATSGAISATRQFRGLS